MSRSGSVLLLAMGAACAGSTGAGTAATVPTPTVTEQASGTRQLIQAVVAIDRDVVWASGHGAVVLRSVDGGANWALRPVPGSEGLEFRDVHAVSADTAWILAAGAGTKSRIYRTTDGGARWTLQFQNADTAAFYDCFAFLDRRTAIAFGDASNGATNILRTSDGGEHWVRLPSAQVPPPLPGEGAFASSGLCVAATSPRVVHIATGSPGARLFTSTDAGERFSAAATPFVHSATAGLTGLAFSTPLRGMAVAADIDRLKTDTSSAVVGITADGGRSWTLGARPPLPGALSGAAWVPGAGPNTAVVVGFGGAFITTDAAKSWVTLSDALYTGVAAARNRAWIVGGAGRITRLDW